MNENNFYPKSQNEWREWLKKNHVIMDSVWVIFYKKATGKPSLSWSEAVDEALCFGWIDSVKKKLDSERYIQFFSKRKPSSTWSKINKDKVEKLISEGKMEKAGFSTIEISKQNGNWSILDDVENLILPSDLKFELEKYDGAIAFYEGLTKSYKKAILYWVVMAKREITRKKRVEEVAKCAGLQCLPKHFI